MATACALGMLLLYVALLSWKAWHVGLLGWAQCFLLMKRHVLLQVAGIVPVVRGYTLSNSLLVGRSRFGYAAASTGVGTGNGQVGLWMLQDFQIMCAMAVQRAACCTPRIAFHQGLVPLHVPGALICVMVSCQRLWQGSGGRTQAGHTSAACCHTWAQD